MRKKSISKTKKKENQGLIEETRKSFEKNIEKPAAMPSPGIG